MTRTKHQPTRKPRSPVDPPLTESQAPVWRETRKPDCKALLGGMIAGLCMVADTKDVREAVQWWSRNQKGWIHFASFAAKEKAASK